MGEKEKRAERDDSPERGTERESRVRRKSALKVEEAGGCSARQAASQAVSAEFQIDRWITSHIGSYSVI